MLVHYQLVCCMSVSILLQHVFFNLFLFNYFFTSRPFLKTAGGIVLGSVAVSAVSADVLLYILVAIKASFLKLGMCNICIFYLPAVFENGGRYCFGVRRRLRRPRRLRRLRRLRGCFALYLGCY